MLEEEKKIAAEQELLSDAHAELEVRKQRYEEMLARTQKMKKRMIVISLSVLALLAVLFSTLIIAEYLKLKKASEPPIYEYVFSPTYDRPFSENAAYMAQDRKIYYCDSADGNGLTVELTEGMSDRSQAFLYFYIQVIQSGNAEVYNTLFNDHYLAANAPQATFSPQMLYDISIRYYSKSADENGDMIYAYLIDYKIHENDGSFRRDIGSDMSRTQYIALRVPQAGAVTVKELYVIYESNPEVEEPSVALFVSLIAVPVLLLAGVVVALIVYRKKGRAQNVEK